MEETTIRSNSRGDVRAEKAERRRDNFKFDNSVGEDTTYVAVPGTPGYSAAVLGTLYYGVHVRYISCHTADRSDAWRTQGRYS